MITIAEEILRRADGYLDAPAVEGSAQLTYRELIARGEALAAVLRRETPPGALVASEAATSHCGLTAVLAAGLARRALLPLDLGYPPAYREGVIREARAALVLREDASGELVAEVPQVLEGVEPRVGLADTAYVMYTSGSTGKPKGVVISQEALHGRIASLASTPGLARHESMLGMSALSFDVSLAELLVPPFVGARLVSAPAEARRDPNLFEEVLDRYHPDVLQATPSYWRLALAMGWEGAPQCRIWSVGEAMNTTLAAELVPLCRELWNLYGPTEATIYATIAHVRSPERIVLGDSLPGTAVCLAGHGAGPSRTAYSDAPADPDGAADPEGTADADGADPKAEPQGEILIYGAGLADGYLDREELTRERFTVMDTPHGPRRCYRTGDLGRLASDGELEFLGRLDDQLKFRGYRVELGHIEAVFEDHPSVRAAAALALAPEDPARTQLAVMVAAEEAATVRDLRRWAMERLPRAMVPERIAVVPALPRTPAGKADRVSIRATFAAADPR
ncbi:AMP-binding protein [Actinospica durhamensis]|uniref:AMP-binding protein n=1 Tax=Actinospica durhamensis TaxID=1508375 RepID=A0A941ERN0_9ACTN|nr:AMP-binding protein [Actinospica durhamensis]MBR7832549.1 AMP-binding protein [Actinospica durhamensis]